MANEIINTGDGAISIFTHGGELGDVLKPLTKEIFLFDSHIAGTTHLEDGSVLDEVKEGDQVILQREDNKYDKRAIVIFDSKMRKLGYVPERDNVVFSRLMDAGKCLTAKVSKKVTEGWFVRIGIKIYMVDF